MTVHRVALCDVGIFNSIPDISLQRPLLQSIKHLLRLLMCLGFLVECLEEFMVLLAQIFLLKLEPCSKSAF